jgi:GT2 family glycosyltransferase
MLKTAASMQSPKLTVSVIVPVHQDGDSFRRCVSSLVKATPQPEEVLLISDGAGDSIKILAAEFGYRCLQNPSGNGPAKARNFGASNARGDLLFFVDSDVVIRQDSVARVLSAFAEDPHTSAIIGSYDDEPAEPNFLSQYKNLFHHYVHQNSNEEASTFWGACGAIRRQVFMESGGFDESYRRPCIEDIEYGYRLRKSGHRIRLLKTLQCKHLKRWTVLSLLKSDLLDRATPWTELIFRDRMLINDLNLRLSNRLSVALVFLSICLLVAGIWHPLLAAVALVLLAVVLIVNSPLYGFFFSRRKLLFMLGVIPWHIIYCLCCSLGFVAGSARVFARKMRAYLGKIGVHKGIARPRRGV